MDKLKALELIQNMTDSDKINLWNDAIKFRSIQANEPTILINASNLKYWDSPDLVNEAYEKYFVASTVGHAFLNQIGHARTLYEIHLEMIVNSPTNDDGYVMLYEIIESPEPNCLVLMDNKQIIPFDPSNPLILMGKQYRLLRVVSGKRLPEPKPNAFGMANVDYVLS